MNEASPNWPASPAMTLLTRFLFVAAAYTAILSIVANPGIGALTAGCWLSLIFCVCLSLVEGLITRKQLLAFAVTNFLLICLNGFLQLESARVGTFSAYVDQRPHWIDGWPTDAGMLQMGTFAAMCLFANAVGLGTLHGLRRLLK